MPNPKLTADPNWYGIEDVEATLTVPAPDAVANVLWGDVNGNKNDTVAGTSNVSLNKQIKVVTDLLPDAGALTSIAQEVTVDAVQVDVTAVKAVTDLIPNAGAMTSIAQAIALLVSAVDSVANVDIADVIGNKEDAGSLAIDVVSLVALARKGAKEAWETEHHFHNGDVGFGVAAAPAGETHIADRIGTGAAGAEAGPFVLDAGNDDWGTWTQVLGSSDTPITEIPNATHFDMNELTVVATEDDTQRYMWQAVVQEDAPADDPTVGDFFTEGEFFIQAAAVQGSPVLPTRTFRSYRRAVGTKMWMRSRAPNLNTSTMSFYLYGHFYTDPDV